MLKLPAGLRLIRYSPFDLRIFLRLILVFTVWKWLSIDYTALSDLLLGPQLKPVSPWILAPVLRFLEFVFLNSTLQVYTLQIIAALLLLYTAFRLSRLLLFLGLLPVMLFEWCAMLYRAPNYDIDLGVALLIIALILPMSWQGVFIGGDEKITPRATRVGWCLAAYVGGMYFMCGVSKLTFDPHWWMHVHLELLYFVMQVWHGAKFPAWQEPLARGIHEVFWQFPLLWQSAAFLTMCCELCWVTAIFSSVSRRIVPLLMLGSHLMIYLASTILFLGMAVIGFSSIVPWRNLCAPASVSYNPACRASARMAAMLKRLDWFRRLSVVPETDWKAGAMITLTTVDQNGAFANAEAFFYACLRCPVLLLPGAIGLLPGMLWASQRLWGTPAQNRLPQAQPAQKLWQGAGPAAIGSFVLSMAIVLFVVVVPSLQGASYFPFDNYDAFGWSYGDIAHGIIKPVIRLGYYDEQRQKVRHIPLNYAGFFEFRMTDDVSLDIEQYLTSDTREEKLRALQRIWQYVRATRPYHSNRWILGPLALPCHFVSYSDPLPLQWFRHVYVWLSLYRVENDRLWQTSSVMAEIPPLPEKRHLWPRDPQYKIPGHLTLGDWHPVSMGPSYTNHPRQPGTL